MSRIGVAATAPFGADVLRRLAPAHDIAFLLTRPDAPKGRGRNLAAPPAKEVASRLGIPALQPRRLAADDGELGRALAEVDAVVVAAYGILIPDTLLDETLWLNVHPSLLPRWRGAAPVERAIMAGDQETGVTIHRTVAQLDAGPIAARSAFPIEDDDDAGVVFSRAADDGADRLNDVLVNPTFVPQPSEGVTYAEKITAADRELDWRRPPREVHDRVRALSPHIGARGVLEGRRVLVWKTRVHEERLEILEVQPEGRRRMTYDEFLRGLR